MSSIEVRGQTPTTRQTFNTQRHPLENTALGMVSTRSFPAIVGTADMMLKSSGVKLVGYEQVGSGYCTAIVRGNFADVRLAVEEGAKTAEQFGQLISKSVIPRPMPNLEVVLPISSRLANIARQQGHSRLSNQSLGMLETRGFPALVGAADAMLKAADVHLESYTKTGNGLCTIIVRGTVANVAVAIEAGMYEAERIGELNAIMIIPRPLEDLEQSLPVASHWLEQNELLPVLLPKAEEEKSQPLQLPEIEKVQLPEFEKVPLALEEEQKQSTQGENME